MVAPCISAVLHNVCCIGNLSAHCGCAAQNRKLDGLIPVSGVTVRHRIQDLERLFKLSRFLAVCV